MAHTIEVSVLPFRQGLKVLQLCETLRNVTFAKSVDDPDLVTFIGKSTAANIGAVSGTISEHGEVVFDDA